MHIFWRTDKNILRSAIYVQTLSIIGIIAQHRYHHFIISKLKRQISLNSSGFKIEGGKLVSYISTNLTQTLSNATRKKTPELKKSWENIVTRSRRTPVIDRWGGGYLLHKGGDGAEVPAERKLDRLQQDPRCCVGHDRLRTHHARFLAPPPGNAFGKSFWTSILGPLDLTPEGTRGEGSIRTHQPRVPPPRERGGGVSTLKTNPASLGGNCVVEKEGVCTGFCTERGVGGEGGQ